MSQKIVKAVSLYMDESGARHPDHKPGIPTHGKDWFALGGIMINDEEVAGAEAILDAFRVNWPQMKDSPLHSYEIRGSHKNFAWLGSEPGLKDRFMTDLQTMLLSLPIIGIACVMDRPGHNAKYKERYEAERWLLCKTAFTIAVERSAKWAIANERKLRVFIEKSNKKEEKSMQAYFDSMRATGHCFDPTTAAPYLPLGPASLTNCLYQFKPKPKSSGLMQVADLMLWPMCMGGYDSDNRVYKTLLNAGKVIDCHLAEWERPLRGIKYSCLPPK